MPTNRAMLAEFVGTFALMFIGGAAIIVDGNLLVVALAHGLILAVMVSATLHLSGAQFNPSVSIALSALGRQPWSRAATFIVVQLLATTTAALLLRSLLGGAYEVGNLGATLGALSLDEVDGAANVSRSVVATVTLEIIATFFLMFVIMGVAVDDRGVGKSATVAGMAIGLTVAALILAIGPATGASMNPARSFGPALAAGAWDMHWAYWLAPIVGAALAGFVYRLNFGCDAADAPAD